MPEVLVLVVSFLKVLCLLPPKDSTVLELLRLLSSAVSELLHHLPLEGLSVMNNFLPLEKSLVPEFLLLLLEGSSSLEMILPLEDPLMFELLLP